METIETEIKKRLQRFTEVQEEADNKEQRILEAEEKYRRFYKEWEEGARDWDDVVEAYNEAAEIDGELGGCPILTDIPLVMEKNHPYGQLDGACDNKLSSEIKHEEQQVAAYHLWEAAGKPEGDGSEFWEEAGEEIKNPDKRRSKDRYQVVNQWYSERRRADIVIWYDREEKRYFHHTHPDLWEDRLNIQIKTNYVGTIWSLRAEQKAQEKIRKHISKEQYRSYMLTGMFYEDSKRSKLRYMFRRSRPTLVFSPRKDYNILCSLCSHGTGYYLRTWAGVLSPTDDVIIHLMQMRTDEYGYWKHSNQHPPYSALSGI